MLIFLDSNIREKYFKDPSFRSILPPEIARFYQLKIPHIKQGEFYMSPFTFYENAGLGRLKKIEVNLDPADLKKLKKVENIKPSEEFTQYP